MKHISIYLFLIYELHVSAEIFRFYSISTHTQRNQYHILRFIVILEAIISLQRDITFSYGQKLVLYVTKLCKQIGIVFLNDYNSFPTNASTFSCRNIAFTFPHVAFHTLMLWYMLTQIKTMTLHFSLTTQFLLINLLA